jgi:hypothetical protein
MCEAVEQYAERYICKSGNILSERLEDNEAAAEWGRRQAELMKKSDEITQRLLQKYTPILIERHAQKSGAGNSAKK